MHSFTHEKLKLKPHSDTISHPSDWQIFKSLTMYFADETRANIHCHTITVETHTPTKGNLWISNKFTAILLLGIYLDDKPLKYENTQVQAS